VFKTFGALYNWNAAVNRDGGTSVMDGMQGVCPAGWHLPSDEEWKKLEESLGMSESVIDLTGWRGTDQGTQLKSTEGWNSKGNGDNSSGFSGLPGGGIGEGLGNAGFWWSSTGSVRHPEAWCRGLSYLTESVFRVQKDAGYALSVRCIKN
jgi:uncharacterized protein (TIGR02145 family)